MLLSLNMTHDAVQPGAVKTLMWFDSYGIYLISHDKQIFFIGKVKDLLYTLLTLHLT